MSANNKLRAADRMLSSLEVVSRNTLLETDFCVRDELSLAAGLSIQALGPTSFAKARLGPTF